MIENKTAEFFEKHWSESLGPAPMWSAPWPVDSQGPIPNGDRQGCYCLYQGDDPQYIGLGASRGSGLYKEHGIGRRLYSHVLQIDATKGVSDNKGFYMARERWRQITHLRTIGFPSGTGYLAPALELFLLAHLPPALTPFNTVRPGSVPQT